MYPNELTLVEIQNQQPGVFLKMADYQQMLKALEVLKSTSNYHAIQNQPVNTQKILTEFLNRVAIKKERMTLTYQKNVFLAVVPIEDFEVIEQLEDCIDNADADDALKEEASTPWEQVKQELGL